jgi:hypothetical protein
VPRLFNACGQPGWAARAASNPASASADQPFFRLALLGKNNTQEMTRREILRVGSQRLPVQPFGIRQVSAAVQRNRLVDQGLRGHEFAVVPAATVSPLRAQRLSRISAYRGACYLFSTTNKNNGDGHV